MGELSPTHWLILIVVAILLFGAQRLPDVARGMGRSIRVLKSELSGNPDTQAASTHGATTSAEATNSASPNAGATNTGATNTGTGRPEPEKPSGS